MSEIKVNKISPRTNCGTVQLGDSGDTITIPAGATITNNGTQTGFGRTGAVDWETTPKTTTFTATSGEGYFVDTSSGAVTANLPAGSPGAIVAFADYTRTFATHNLTIDPNGSEKIGGGTAGQEIILSSNGEAITLVYVDGTEGWINVQKATDTETGTLPAFIAATGGTVATCGDFKVHTFTGPGTFCVSSGGNSLGSNSVEYIVVAGGASGGGGYYGGGGGAGGFRFASPTLAPLTYPAKPLAAPANVPVSVQGYPIAVGGGGATQSSPCNRGNSGVASSFSTITSTGGGGGGVWGPVPSGNVPLRSGVAGGSGGGAGSNNSPAPTAGAAGTGGAGNTPPVSPAQGKDGGDGVTGASGSCSTAASAGGGGATACGGQGPAGPGGPGVGGVGGAGAGVPSAFGTSGVNCGSNYYFAGGGGGAGSSNTGNTGGLGGGGFGGRYVGPAPPSNDGQAGTANTGGGGGGAINNCRNSGAGGSGIVIIRYKFQ